MCRHENVSTHNLLQVEFVGWKRVSYLPPGMCVLWVSARYTGRPEGCGASHEHLTHRCQDRQHSQVEGRKKSDDTCCRIAGHPRKHAAAQAHPLHFHIQSALPQGRHLIMRKALPPIPASAKVDYTSGIGLQDRSHHQPPTRLRMPGMLWAGGLTSRMDAVTV